jgi:hypothetical protein
VIVLRNSLPDLPCGGTNDGIEVGVVIPFPRKNFNAERPLFKRRCLSLQSLFHNVAEQVGIAFAITEQGIRKNPLELFLDRLAFGLGPA